MSSIRKKLNILDISGVAIPSNVRYGTAIFERGGVELTLESDKRIEAVVGGLEGSSAEGGGGKRKVPFG